MIIINYLLIGFVLGMIFPIQATLGARINSGSKNKLTGSMVAFVFGSVILFIINAVQQPTVFLNSTTYQGIPLYYLIGGGIVGVVYNASVMNLFTRIGAFYTTIFTLLGQLIIGVVIDALGLFSAPIRTINLINIIGILMVLVAAVYINTAKKNDTQKLQLQYVIPTVILGMLPPLQQVFNRGLSEYVGSPLIATFMSFFIGAVLLVVLILAQSHRINVPRVDGKGKKIPISNYFAGAIGIAIIMGNILILPILGSTLSSVVAQVGQIVMAMILDHFALLGMEQKPIQIQKVVAVLAIVLGIVLLKL